MSVDATLEAVVRRDRLVVVTALTAVIALSWAYLLAGAGMGMSAFEMTRMSQIELAGDMAGMAMMTPAVWTLGYVVLMFVMWWIMMVAMMLPSAAPMILLFATLNRKQRDTGQPYVATSIFALGYLAAWAGFSLVAVSLQWGFERTTLLSPTLVGTTCSSAAACYSLRAPTNSPRSSRPVCATAGSPLAFLGTHWRRGARGALRMGLEHGAYCVGCCWFLMGLLFFGGVMNLYWIVGLALFVLVEKMVPPATGSAPPSVSCYSSGGLRCWRSRSERGRLVLAVEHDQRAKS